MCLVLRKEVKRKTKTERMKKKKSRKEDDVLNCLVKKNRKHAY